MNKILRHGNLDLCDQKIFVSFRYFFSLLLPWFFCGNLINIHFLNSSGSYQIGSPFIGVPIYWWDIYKDDGQDLLFVDWGMSQTETEKMFKWSGKLLELWTRFGGASLKVFTKARQCCVCVVQQGIMVVKSCKVGLGWIFPKRLTICDYSVCAWCIIYF